MNIVEQLRNLLSEEQVTINETVLYQHSKDESYHVPHNPDVVVFPKNAQEVSTILKFANDHEIPIVPFGLGSGLEGHVIPYHGGISIDFQFMNQVLEVRPDDFLVRVQPGVTRTQVNKVLKDYGLFFSVDPGADATLGGMASTNASGTTAVRYGVMRDQVRDLEVVLADGRMIHTGGLAAKSSSGYHLNGLFVGSEGTLGVFTELTLRVYGIPEATIAARATFPTVKQVVSAATSLLASGLPVSRTELVDELSMKQVNAHSQTNYPEQPTLFLEFQGTRAGLEESVELAKELVLEEGAESFEFETDSLARAKLWEARHHVAYAFNHGYPGKRIMSTDVCVPLSEIAGAVANAKELIKEYGLDAGLVGHVGDGNYHTTIMIDLNDADEVARAEEYNQKIVEYALSRGGTCTGEHGVGAGKIKYQEKEHGEALNVMLGLKQLLDPKGILNPGKLLPTVKSKSVGQI